MAFVIKCRMEEEARTVLAAVETAVKQSRFWLRETPSITGRRSCRVVFPGNCIRLRQKKDYCGNHAGPCRLQNRTHRKGAWLEGADWVAWNDLLNDVLDNLNHGGDAGSSYVSIRKAGKRRLVYEQKSKHGDWVKVGQEEDYIDRRGQQSPGTSAYPQGTPGIPSYQKETA